jgi:peptidoglycan L-alanyl-D-glutamate endopeptidase CwlK
LRSIEEQEALYAQGREDIVKVNALRKLAGMPPLGTKNRIVTHARPGYSLHNFGLAFDVVPLDAGKPIWDASHPVWQRIGNTGKEANLEWAGDWKRFKEYPHFQYTSGLSLSEIREGKRPATEIATMGNL